MTPRMLHRLLATASFAALPLLIMAATPATTASRVAGTFTMNYTEQHPIPILDADGHVLLQTASTGTNQSTGPTSYMAGAETSNAELADLVQGNGTHQGYVTMSLNGNVEVTRWSGKVTTTLGPDQKPVTTFQGTWTKVKGASGHGTYSGRITGPASYVVDWVGEMDLKQPAASR